jgi:hypothetical protein
MSDSITCSITIICRHATHRSVYTTLLYHSVVMKPLPWLQDQSASFSTLRAVGAFLVSASLDNGQVHDVYVLSKVGGNCTVQVRRARLSCSKSPINLTYASIMIINICRVLICFPFCSRRETFKTSSYKLGPIKLIYFNSFVSTATTTTTPPPPHTHTHTHLVTLSLTQSLTHFTLPHQQTSIHVLLQWNGDKPMVTRVADGATVPTWAVVIRGVSGLWRFDTAAGTNYSIH